jgi:hypothetical protein
VRSMKNSNICRMQIRLTARLNDVHLARDTMLMRRRAARLAGRRRPPRRSRRSVLCTAPMRTSTLLPVLLAVRRCAADVHYSPVQGPPKATPTARATWQPHEIALTSSASYPPAIAWRGSSIQLNATFTLNGDEDPALVLSVPGFWDGNQNWKVRMALPQAGDWHWRTTCSNASDTGLHDQSGHVTVADYSGANPLFKHGFLRPHSSGRFLEHMDGTPFYWLGDTHWSGFSTAEHWADSDNATVDPGPSEHSMLREMVDVRAAQGYSVWKGETFVVNGKQGGSAGSIANAGGTAWGEGGMYGDLRPEFWQAIDDIMAYINSKGIVVSHAFAGIGRGLSNQSMVAPIMDLARYNVARYELGECARLSILHHSCTDCTHSFPCYRTLVSSGTPRSAQCGRLARSTALVTKGGQPQPGAKLLHPSTI